MTLLHKYLDAKSNLHAAEIAIEEEFSRITRNRYGGVSIGVRDNWLTVYSCYPTSSMTEDELDEVWVMGFAKLALEFAEGVREEYVED